MDQPGIRQLVVELKARWKQRAANAKTQILLGLTAYTLLPREQSRTMSNRKRVFLLVAALIAFRHSHLLLWPVPISPQAWTPPPAPPLTAQYHQNSLLSTTERLSLGTETPSPGAGFGPEDVALDAEGRIYTGLDDGRIMRLQADGTKPEAFSNTARPAAGTRV